MITLNKNSSNSLIFTLTEKSRLPVPFYLFSFVDDTSKEQVLFNSTDLSGYPRRFNQFDIIESGSTNPSQGIIELNYGFGTYEVYEATGATLNITGTTGRVLEEGKYYVNGYPTAMQANSITNIYL